MPLHFELVTPEKLVRSEDVYMVTVPGTEGDSTLRDGELLVFPTQGAAPSAIRVEGGFAEVNERGLTVLAERAEA
jgi:F-type H+-transporting ATPase subunit epsilon